MVSVEKLFRVKGKLVSVDVDFCASRVVGCLMVAGAREWPQQQPLKLAAQT